MKKKYYSKGALAAASVALMVITAGCSSSGETASAEVSEQVTLRIPTLFGPEHWQTVALKTYTDEVTELSEGTLEFEYYYGDALIPPAETTSGLKSGAVDMAYTLLSYTPADYPISNWISNAASLKESTPDAGNLQGMAAVLEWSYTDESYLKDFEDAGIVPLLPRFFAHESYGLLCKEPNTSEESIEGNRVRVGGTTWAEEAQALNMVPVDMPSTETYTAFQQGLIDCFMGGPSDVDSIGLMEHGKYYNDAGFTGFDSASLLISEDIWDSFSEQQKDATWDALPVYLKSWYEQYRTANFEFVENAEAEGVAIEAPDTGLQDTILSYQESVRDELATEAPGGVSEPEGTLDSYIALHEKWLPMVQDLGHSNEYQTWSEFYDATDGEAPELTEWIELIKTEILDQHRPE